MGFMLANSLVTLRARKGFGLPNMNSSIGATSEVLSRRKHNLVRCYPLGRHCLELCMLSFVWSTFSMFPGFCLNPTALRQVGQHPRPML